MIWHKGHRTLKEDIEQLEKDKRKSKRKINFVIKFVFSLIFLAASYFLDVLYDIVAIWLILNLFLCLLARYKFRKEKEHQKITLKQDRQTTNLAMKILILYLILCGFVLTVYGSMNYIFHLPNVQFRLKDWFKGSVLLVLLFESLILRFYRKREREV